MATRTINDFLTKEYKEFALYNNKRMIPSIIDGFKPVQRKILYTLLKKNLPLIKVTQLSGYVMAETEYIHGESSLQSSIINMAKPHKGYCVLLVPEGQFGTRLDDSSAAPRYLHTKLNHEEYNLFFNNEDFPILPLTEEGEPEFFLPKIPLALVNESQGLGVGFRCNIYPYDPISIIDFIISLLENKALPALKKSYPYYKGKIKALEKNKFLFTSIVNKKDSNYYEILDVPPQFDIFKIREILNKMKEEKLIIDYEDLSYENTFYIKIKAKNVDEKKLNFTHTISENLILFSTNNIIKQYGSPEEIIEEFTSFRLKWYSNRLNYMINNLSKKIEESTSLLLILENFKVEEISKYQDSILSKISLIDLKPENIQKLRKKIEGLKLELNTLKSTNNKNLFLSELLALKKALENRI